MYWGIVPEKWQISENFKLRKHRLFHRIDPKKAEFKVKNFIFAFKLSFIHQSKDKWFQKICFGVFWHQLVVLDGKKVKILIFLKKNILI